MAKGKALRISHFRVEEQLRRDELGYFFRAVDEQLDRPVVLRVVRAGQVTNGGAPGPMRQRIRAQARAASMVSHPNLVTIYEFRSLAETDIVVMERVEGQTLEDLRNAGRRWTVVELARLLARLGDALAAAHDAGLVHGNINAANIRVRPDGRFKLLDLGIPKLDTIEEAVPHDPSDDVRGLARIACGLLGPPIEMTGDDTDREADPLTDPTKARARYGFLAPVLMTALRDAKGYVNGAAFRDAVLQAMEMASGRAGHARDIGSGFSTHVLGPNSTGAAEDVLPAESPLFEALAQGGSQGGPRLVLPQDLAERAPARDTFNPNAIHLLLRSPQWRRRLARLTGPRVVIAAVLIGALAVAATVVVRRVTRAPVAAATLDQEQTDGDTGPVAAGAADSLTLAAEGSPAADTVTGSGVPADDTLAGTAAEPARETTGAPPVFTAPVRVTPAGATIRVVGGGGGPWTDDAEVGVASGDTLVLEFSRAGYVTQRRDFVGRRISVALQPDSVVAQFRSNIAAEVFLMGRTGDVRVGTTNTDVRLPTGTHRFVYRAPGQEDWQTTVPMTTPGRTYPVSKTDYVTFGSFVATAAPTWATVSVDGGLPRETPARFDSLSVGRHVVTVTRDSFTVVDTVIVSAGGTERRNYTIRR